MADPWEEFQSQPQPWDEYNKPQYNYVSPPDGADEDILFEQNGETVKAPPGTGAVIQYAQNDDTFAPAPSSFIEETSANVEKQAAYMGYLAWNAGLLSDSDAADFIAERSKALAYAQSRYPEYVKKFNEDFDAQEGIFGKAWVVLNNPSAIIRSNVAQSPNGIIPLTGFVTGLGIGSLFGPGGTVAGGFTGSVSGGTAINTGARMDEILIKQGFDPSDANSLMEAFSKPEVRDQLVQTATASGLSQSVVEALFDMVAGKYLKIHSASSLTKKTGAALTETAIQSGGEMLGEATGQGVAYGPDKIDVGDVLLEGVTSLPQSAATIAIGAMRRPNAADVEIETAAKAVGDIEAEKQKAVIQQKKIIRKGGDDSEIRQKIVELDSQKNEAVLRLSDLVTQKEAQTDSILKTEKDNVADKSQEIREGRIKKLTDDIKPIERQLDFLEAKFFEEIAEGQSTKATENKINALLEKKGQYEYEIEVMRDESLSKPENLAAKDITVKGSDIINAEKKSARQRAVAVVKGFKEGIERAKTDINTAQKEIIDLVKSSGLGKEAVGLFEKEILSANTPEKAARRLPKVQEKVVQLLDNRLRDETVTNIRKAVKRAARSRVIDIDFAKRVQMAVRDIDFTKRTEKTRNKLQSALDFYQKNTDKKPPKKLLEKLKLLNKKQSGEMTTTELLGVLEEVTSLIRKGKKKQTIKKMEAQNKLNMRLNALAASTTITKFHVGRAPLGKRLAVTQQMKNSFAEIANKIETVRISKNSMDVFFDMIDGAVKYKGAAYNIFKKTMDVAHSKYLNLRDDTSKEVVELTRKNKYTKENYDNIGAYAALMQDGGRDKLLSAGLTNAELDSLMGDSKEKILYHGTPFEFDRFEYDKNHISGSYHGKGFYFTEKLKDAEVYSLFYNGKVKEQRNKKGNVLKVKVRLTNPLDTEKIGKKNLTEQQLADISKIPGVSQAIKNIKDERQQYLDIYKTTDIRYGDLQEVASKAMKILGKAVGPYKEIVESLGFDGIKVGDGEWVVYDPNNIQIIEKQPAERVNKVGEKAFLIKTSGLTEQEMELYKAMRKAFDRMYPKVASVMADVYNQDVKKNDNYFPFITDFEKDNGKRIDEIINRQVEPDIKNTKKQKNINRDFTIERTGGKVAIKIDAMKIFMQHVDNASYLVEMARDIKELAELAGKQEFQDIVGDMAQEFTIDWLDLLARKGRDPNSIKTIDVLRRNTGLAVLAYRISSMAVQTTALLDGAALIGSSYVSRGTTAMASSEWRKFVYENMPEVRDRIGDDPFWETMGGTGVWKKTQEAGMYGIKKIDHFCAASVAAGAYIRAVESRGGTVDLSKPDADAIQEAQLYMRRTQSSAFAKDNPLLLSKGKLTGSSSWDKLIFQFQSFLLNRWSIISHDLFRTSGIKPTQQSLSIAACLILANVLEYGIRVGSKEALEGLWSAMGMGVEPPEEEDDLTEIVVKQAVSNVPFVSSFVRSLEYGQPPVPVLSLFVRGWDEYQYAMRSKDPDKARRHYLNSVAILGGGLFLGTPGISQLPAITKSLAGSSDKGWGDDTDWGKGMDWGEKPTWK